MLIDNYLLPIRFEQTVNQKHPFPVPDCTEATENEEDSGDILEDSGKTG